MSSILSLMLFLLSIQLMPPTYEVVLPVKTQTSEEIVVFEDQILAIKSKEKFFIRKNGPVEIAEWKNITFRAKFAGTSNYQTIQFPDFLYEVRPKGVGKVVLTLVPPIVNSLDDIKELSFQVASSNQVAPTPPTPPAPTKITDKLLVIHPTALSTELYESLFGDRARGLLSKYNRLIVVEDGIDNVDDKDYKELLKRPRSSVPWLVTGTYEGPYPKTFVELQALLLKHNPK